MRDYVVVLGGGRLLAEGKIQDLKLGHEKNNVFEVRLKSDPEDFRKKAGGSRLPGGTPRRSADRPYSRGGSPQLLWQTAAEQGSKSATCGRNAAPWKRSS